jgi:hypothetical protein
MAEARSQRWVVETDGNDDTALAEAFAVAGRLRALGKSVAIGLTGASSGRRVLAVERRAGAFVYVLRVADAAERTFDSLDDALKAAAP